MRQILLGLLLALVGCSQWYSPNIHDQQLSTVRLDIATNDGHGICSGTAVAPNVILTAEHCLRDSTDPDSSALTVKKTSPFSVLLIPEDPTSIQINGRDTKIISIISDGDDHALVEVDFTFDYTASLALDRPREGAHIHYWGNPAGMNMLYREGYVVGYHHGMMLMNVNGFFGDSGAGIFDETGHIVGVVNVIGVHQHKGLDFTLMGSAPLEFTDQQYEMMGVAH